MSSKFDKTRYGYNYTAPNSAKQRNKIYQEVRRNILTWTYLWVPNFDAKRYGNND